MSYFSKQKQNLILVTEINWIYRSMLGKIGNTESVVQLTILFDALNQAIKSLPKDDKANMKAGIQSESLQIEQSLIHNINDTVNSLNNFRPNLPAKFISCTNRHNVPKRLKPFQQTSCN